MANLPFPPFVVVPGIANFRDLGGYPTSSGKTVRTGLMYRAADPSNATQEGLEKMSTELGITDLHYLPSLTCPVQNHQRVKSGLQTIRIIPTQTNQKHFQLTTPPGIKSIYDLRSESEVKKDPSSESAATDIFTPHAMTRHWTPVFATGAWGPEQLSLRYKNYARSGPSGFVAAYRDILTAGPEAFEKVLRTLAGPEPKPVLFHCSAGKDRTGVLGAVVLLLLGVEGEKVAEEYALTDLGLRELKPGFVERLLAHPAMDGSREGVENMVSSKKENMVATIEMLEREFGGAERYVREKVGLSESEVERLRRNLLV